MKLKLLLWWVGLCTALPLLHGADRFPFATDTAQLTVWNGSAYVPFFIKGVNLGVAVPGTFPGEMAAQLNDYARWFRQIQEAGFNCIRLYTLHFPRFYEVLDSFNTAHPEHPLLFMQGVWLEEELPGYDGDLYQLSTAFQTEAAENIDCVFGQKIIAARNGKAFGTYRTDVSKWCLAFLLGREVFPTEILTTNQRHPDRTAWSGSHFAIESASASETWCTQMADQICDYVWKQYATGRPMGFSSWPTLDPIPHPGEANRMEDTVSVDLSKIRIKEAPAGYFISYHAYPYYPDFVSEQPSYRAYSDAYGPNSYLGYLSDLKAHYKHFPLLIAEYGVPSSWAIAHYSSSGMNHGGFDEYHQGLTDVRLLENIRATGCAGGIQFAWIDEWFKRTWVTDPLDTRPERRVFWHNLASAEQNFGLMAYGQERFHKDLIPLQTDKSITRLEASVNHECLELHLDLKEPFGIPDELWLSLDTYADSLGESRMPDGDTLPSRAEFVLHLSNYDAQLYVTQAYDAFGIWHGTSDPLQQYHSTATNGAPWKLVRLRNNTGHSEVQYIGNLQVNRDNQPSSSNDGVVVGDHRITVRLPWFYLNVTDPSSMRVLHDQRATPAKEDTLSDGIRVGIRYRNEWFDSHERLRWPTWSVTPPADSMERKKASYFVLQERLRDFNTPATAVRDSFRFEGPYFPITVPATEGLLQNDFDLDGDTLAALVDVAPSHGHFLLNNDGSFEYWPDRGFIGLDSLRYRVYDGRSLSQSNAVVVWVERNAASRSPLRSSETLSFFTDEVSGVLTLEPEAPVTLLEVFAQNGRCIDTKRFASPTRYTLNTAHYPNGVYLLLAHTKQGIVSGKFVKTR